MQYSFIQIDVLNKKFPQRLGFAKVLDTSAPVFL